MRIGERKVIYSVEIDYSYKRREKGYRLHHPKYERRYETNEKELDVEELENEIKKVIVFELPEDLRRIFGIKVKTELIGIRYGSLIFFLSAVFTGFNIVSNYKSFYDSVYLLKRHLSRLIEDLFETHYPEMLQVEIGIEYPSLPEPGYNILKELSRKDEFFKEYIGSFQPDFEMTSIRRRDSFFYFLLILSIVSLIIIALLVYGAVVKTYFP